MNQEFLHITVSRAMQKTSKSIAPLSILNHMQMLYCIMHFLQINSNSSSGYLCEFLDKSNEHLYAFAELCPLIVTLFAHIPCSLRRLKFKLHFHKSKRILSKQNRNRVKMMWSAAHFRDIHRIKLEVQWTLLLLVEHGYIPRHRLSFIPV